jgi:arsenate reductase (glutaredoxin)
MSNPIIYGIPNCDTVKKVFTWFKAHNLPFEFHNYKTAGISAAKLKEWSKLAGWETFFNKKSTTWKELAPALEKETLTQAKAFKLMQEHNSIIRRPVIETNGTIVVGFNEAAYEKQFL